MRLITLPTWILYPQPPPSIETAVTTNTLSASGHKDAFIFRAPKTGTLDSFEHCITFTTISANSVLRFSFQDVDAATGLPDGTQDQYKDVTGLSAGAGQWIAPGTMTSDGTANGTKRTVTKGDWLAAVIQYQTFTASDSVAVLRRQLAATDTVTQGVWTASHNGTSWSKNTHSVGLVALKYTDGYEAIKPAFLATAQKARTELTNTVNTASGNIIGNRFTVPFDCRVAGMWWIRDALGSTSAGAARLYDANDNIIASSTLPVVKMTATEDTGTVGYTSMVLYDSEVDLGKNALYRLTINTTDATGWGLTACTYHSSDHLVAGMTGDANWYSTQWTGSGDWTDTNTRTVAMGLIISGIRVPQHKRYSFAPFIEG